jgi:hypothetical protein
MQSHLQRLNVLGVDFMVDWTWDDEEKELVQIDSVKCLHVDQELVELLMCHNVLDAIADVIKHVESERNLP